MLVKFLTLCCIFSFTFINAQNIEGIVMDRETQKPVPDAHILFENTALQVYTDKGGKFSLTNDTRGKNFIVSHISYKLVSRGVPFDGILIDTIWLESASNMLQKVVITEEKDQKIRKTRIAQFKKDLFDSETISKSLSKEIDLINPEVILFEQHNDTLKASSNQLIKFSNKYLGYEMQFYLREYTHTERLTEVIGKAFFEPFDTKSKKYNRSKFENRRRDIWANSEQAFFQNLLIHDLNLNTPIYEKRDDGNFYNFGNIQQLYKRVYKTKYEGVYALLVPHRLYINNKDRVSEIGSKNNVILFNSQGVVLNKLHYDKIGYWQRKSITELLPNSYCKNIATIISKLYTKTYDIGDLRNMAIELYNYSQTKEITTCEIITDKFYYDITDKIYVDAIINDYQKMKSSSESEIIYIELINSNNEIVNRKTRQIKKGKCTVSFDVADNYQGLYSIRAYTDYMHSFNYRTFGHKTIAIQMKPSIAKLSSIYIRCFPEGGFYNYNSNNRIALKISNSNNEGVRFTGLLKDNYLDTSYIINTIDKGIAVIDIPIDSLSNFEILHDKSSIIHDLNEHVEKHSKTGLQVLDRRTYYRINANVYEINKEYRLEISQRGTRVFSTPLTNNRNTYKIDKDYIPTGNLLVAIIDTNNRVLNQRYINNKPVDILEIENQYSYYYTGQTINIDLTNKLYDSLLYNLRVVHNNNLNSSNTISNEKIEHLALISKKIPYIERYFHDIEIPEGTHNHHLKLSGIVTDFDNNPVKAYVTMQVWSSNPFIQETVTSDNGVFNFTNIPFAKNEKYIIQARLYDESNEEPIKGDRDVNIKINNEERVAVNMVWDNTPMLEKHESTLDSAYNISFDNSIILDEVDINGKTDYFKTQVNGSYIINNIDWIQDEMSAFHMLQSLYPRARIKSDLNTASDYLIYVRFPKEVFTRLEVFVNGTSKSGSILNTIKKNQIISMSLRYNVLYIFTYPNGQTKDEIHKKYHGIITYSMKETEESFDSSLLGKTKYDGSNLDERSTLYWNTNFKLLSNESKKIQFIASQREGSYSLIATTFHPRYGKIEKRYPILVKSEL